MSKYTALTGLRHILQEMFLFSNHLACTSDSINYLDTVKYDFNVYCHELAPSTITGDRAQVDDSKQFNVLTVIGDFDQI